MPKTDGPSFMVGAEFGNHGYQGNLMYAAHYCRNFAKHWRNAPGAVDWLKGYGADLLDTLSTPGVKENMKKKFPAPKLLVCYNCHAQKDSGLLKCSKCKIASYCNKECQKAHWKEHKEECVAPPS